jgi:hypothetical protein
MQEIMKKKDSYEFSSNNITSTSSLILKGGCSDNRKRRELQINCRKIEILRHL